MTINTKTSIRELSHEETMFVSGGLSFFEARISAELDALISEGATNVQRQSTPQLVNAQLVSADSL